MNSFDFGIKGLPDYLELVDKRLKEQAPQEIGGLSRVLAASGKRLRPGLVIAIAYHSGRKIDDSVIDAATAVELVHLASLVHDDIIDGGTIRHDVPTINSKEGVDIAIIAGDYLLAKGTALACSVSAEVGGIISDTIAKLCCGQAMELTDRFNTGRTADSLLRATKGKTSALFMAACSLGGHVAGLTNAQQKALADFAENFGIAFQYWDDVKDFTGPSDKSATDAFTGNYTLPLILSLQGSNGPKIKKLLRQNDAPAPQILEMLKDEGFIKQAAKEAEVYKQKSLLALKNLDNPGLTEALKSFIKYF